MLTNFLKQNARDIIGILLLLLLPCSTWAGGVITEGKATSDNRPPEIIILGIDFYEPSDEEEENDGSCEDEEENADSEETNAPEEELHLWLCSSFADESNRAPSDDEQEWDDTAPRDKCGIDEANLKESLELDEYSGGCSGVPSLPISGLFLILGMAKFIRRRV